MREGVASSRRSFVNILLGAGFTSLAVWMLYPVVRYLLPPREGQPTVASITLPWTPDQIRPNSGRVFRFGTQPGILLKTPAGELRAFTAVCTHLGCTVQYRDDRQDIWCACHNGTYDLNGKNVSGPPPRPLEPYRVLAKGDEIVVSKSA
jgi:Rieske Fe-S protein